MKMSAGRKGGVTMNAGGTRVTDSPKGARATNGPGPKFVPGHGNTYNASGSRVNLPTSPPAVKKLVPTKTHPFPCKKPMPKPA